MATLTRSPAPVAPRRQRPPGGPVGLAALQRQAGNRAATALVQRDEADPAKPKAMTAYMGFNPEAGKESSALTKRVGAEGVKTVLDDPELEKELVTDEDITWYVGIKLGLSIADPRFTPLVDALKGTSPVARDSIAQLAVVFLAAERGEYDLQRLVLSGHSDGVKVWGEESAGHKPGGILVERDLGNLGLAFPGAAGQVQHVMFSACYSIAAVNLVVKIFPNLESVWSYSGASPDIAGGSAQHILGWEGATTKNDTLAKGDKKGTSALWTKAKGFIVGDPNLADFGGQWSAVSAKWDSVVKPQATGAAAFNKAVLDGVYAELQRLIASPQINHQQAYEAGMMRDVLLRLRYWPKIAEHFASERAALIKSAYAAVSLTPPDFATMGRGGVRPAVKAFTDALHAAGDPADAKKFLDEQLVKGLGQLDASVIPAEWA